MGFGAVQTCPARTALGCCTGCHTRRGGVCHGVLGEGLVDPYPWNMPWREQGVSGSTACEGLTTVWLRSTGDVQWQGLIAHLIWGGLDAACAPSPLPKPHLTKVACMKWPLHRPPCTPLQPMKPREQPLLVTTHATHPSHTTPPAPVTPPLLPLPAVPLRTSSPRLSPPAPPLN